ncbi:unnamed protein product [Prorocentrum cordatum]|uniref:Ion transport domain-containing protein n=1 Tax=Prorocentrum cordatum TaxID=2364126 RepID=A0ABN9Q180_9DINO|nr:unnamed protein product [Polarella glacialis]
MTRDRESTKEPGRLPQAREAADRVLQPRGARARAAPRRERVAEAQGPRCRGLCASVSASPAATAKPSARSTATSSRARCPRCRPRAAWRVASALVTLPTRAQGRSGRLPAPAMPPVAPPRALARSGAARARQPPPLAESSARSRTRTSGSPGTPSSVLSGAHGQLFTEVSRSTSWFPNVSQMAYPPARIWLEQQDGRQIEMAARRSRRGAVPKGSSDVQPPCLVKRRDYNQRMQQWIANPGSPKRLLWDLVGSLLIFYDLVVLPLQICFQLDDTLLTTCGDWLTLIYWTSNMPMMCTVGYSDSGELVMTPLLILKNYLRAWFWLDLAVVVPDWIFSIASLATQTSRDQSSETMKLLRFFRLARIVRLLRLMKLRKISKFRRPFEFRVHEHSQQYCENDFVAAGDQPFCGLLLVPDCGHP